VHCTGDFINPGWEGYMPLQLSNAGPLPIKISPYFPICQLMLIRLSRSPERSYGDSELQSKYVNDDGGPSLWWRDAHVKQLQQRLSSFNISESIQDEILDTVRFQSPAVLSRFFRFVRKQKSRDLDHADQVLERFAARETQRRLLDGAAMAAVPILAAGAISAYTSVLEALEGASLVLVIASIVSLFPAYLAHERREDGYFGRSEMRAARNVRPTSQNSRVQRGVSTTCEIPSPGRYRHFKGGEYDLIDIAHHSETGDLLVIYRSVAEPDRTWVRPAEMFNETVERPEGTFLRFQRTGPSPRGALPLFPMISRAFSRTLRSFQSRVHFDRPVRQFDESLSSRNWPRD
jgi:Protein of unknown function (DUF1653)